MSPDVEAGAKAIYDTKATTTGVNLEVGAKAYVDPLRIDLTPNSEHLRAKCRYLDSAAFVKAKINNAGILALGKRVNQ